MAKEETRTRLREQINAHAVLQLTPEARIEAQREKSEFTMLLLQYYWNDRVPWLHAATEDDAGLQHERAMKRYLDDPDHGAKIGPFDAVAFSVALDSALRGVEPARGTFLAYFYRVYQTQIAPAASETAYLHDPLRESERARVRAHRQVVKWLRRRELCFSDVTEQLYRTIAADLGISRDEVEDVVFYVRNASQPVSLDVPVDAEDAGGRRLVELQADPAGERGYEMIETISRYVRVLEQVCDLDAREYPRMFLSNSVLEQVHVYRDETDRRLRMAPESEPVVRLLLEAEPLFMERVFLRGYLEFVLRSPPEPDCVRNIILAERLRKLNDVTIALYKGVSKAAVSQQRTRYEKQLAAFRAHLEAQEA